MVKLKGVVAFRSQLEDCIATSYASNARSGNFCQSFLSTDHLWQALVHFPPHVTPTTGMLPLASNQRPGKKLIAQLGVSPNGHVFLTLTSLLKQLSSRLAGQDEGLTNDRIAIDLGPGVASCNTRTIGWQAVLEPTYRIYRCFHLITFLANHHLIKWKETCAWFSNLLLAMIGLWKIEPDWVEEGLKGRFSDKGPAVWSLGSIGFKMGTAVSVDCPAVMIEAVLFTWRLLSTKFRPSSNSQFFF